ncbi:MAG: PAS domain-containing protein [Burkholderiales bacterium]|nr:PAS domain-containing protein [Burkholderiales bacterium]
MAAGSVGEEIDTQDWQGKKWAEIVPQGMRGKVEALLEEVRGKGMSRSREISLHDGRGHETLLAISAVRLGRSGPILAAGRNLQAITAIQQRFLRSQQEMEREYWSRRQHESRYQLLFQAATDAVLVVDPDDMRIVEGNAAAARVFGTPREAMVGGKLLLGFDELSRKLVEEFTRTALVTRKTLELRATVRGQELSLAFSPAPFREGSTLLVLIRLRDYNPDERGSGLVRRAVDFVTRTPDGVAITDDVGRITLANPALVALCKAQSAGNIEGRNLGDWLGQDAGEWQQILYEVRARGMCQREFLHWRDGPASDRKVAVSGVLLVDTDPESIGFTVRPCEGGDADSWLSKDSLGHSVERIVAQLGQVAAPHLLREAADTIERYLISVALMRSGQDASAAARLLGISEESFALRRQRLYQADRSGLGGEGGAS